MLHRRSTKLAGLYLIIIMLISLFFSANVYQLSVHELQRGLRAPGTVLNDPLGPGLSQLRKQLRAEREVLFQVARQHVLQRLIVTNIIILVGGGFLSYYLAVRTLRPIEEAHEALERFTGDASHELRTPITAMRTENEVALLNPSLNLTQAKQQLQSNIEELDKLTALTTGLLRLATLDKNYIKAQPAETEKLIQQAIERISPLAEKKAITIKTSYKTTQRILADELSIVEALVILLDNAIKYSSTKAKIEIVVRKDRKQVALDVIDNGIGIKASDLPHVFERFYRADVARSKQQISGYGLGLAIAKNIAEMQSGSLTAKSKPGKGSTFTLSLPAA